MSNKVKGCKDGNITKCKVLLDGFNEQYFIMTVKLFKKLPTMFNMQFALFDKDDNLLFEKPVITVKKKNKGTQLSPRWYLVNDDCSSLEVSRQNLCNGRGINKMYPGIDDNGNMDINGSTYTLNYVNTEITRFIETQVSAQQRERMEYAKILSNRVTVLNNFSRTLTDEELSIFKAIILLAQKINI